MKFYEQKTYMDEDGIKIVELFTEGEYDKETDADPSQKSLDCKFLGVIPKPVMVDQLPLQIGGKMIGIPVMAVQDGFVPLKAKNVTEAFHEFKVALDMLEEKLKEKVAESKLLVPPSAQKKGLII